MRVCIICENSKIEKLRENEKNPNALGIALSASGELPTTHWFCSIPVINQEAADKLIATAELSVMEISEPKEFLTKWNLKIIK